jgi:hypothetical protein
MTLNSSNISLPTSKNPKKELNDEELSILKEKTLLKAKKKADKEKYYINTKELEQLIKEYYRTNFIDDKLAISLYNIAYRISFMPNFINYSWKEEMIGDGLIKEFVALKNKKFNPKKGKAFSYFSMIVYNAFCNRIKKENKVTDVLKEYQAEQYESLLFNQNMKNTNNSDEGSDD